MKWKLNLTKCVFGVPSGKLLGFIVSSRGIEVNPTKVNAIRFMKPPRSKKDMMRLTRCMAALSRFISRLGDKGLPFFKLPKKAWWLTPIAGVPGRGLGEFIGEFDGYFRFQHHDASQRRHLHLRFMGLRRQWFRRLR